LSIKDAFITILFILKKNYFPCEIFNVISENKTIAEILKIIKLNKHKPKIKIVKSKILNQNQYYVSNKKFSQLCVRLNGKIYKDIKDTLSLLNISSI
jgi:hypothetical protein